MHLEPPLLRKAVEFGVSSPTKKKPPLKLMGVLEHPQHPPGSAPAVKLGSWTALAISQLRPHEPCPLFHYWRCFSIGKCRSVRSACPLFGIRRLCVIREQKMYCVYGNSSWYIHGGPLFGGGPLLGGSFSGGFTVLPSGELAKGLWHALRVSAHYQLWTWTMCYIWSKSYNPYMYLSPFSWNGRIWFQEIGSVADQASWPNLSINGVHAYVLLYHACLHTSQLVSCVPLRHQK